jgi:hypothetical protein
VADLGAILASEDSDDGAVEVEDQAGTVIGLVDESLQQSIVDPMKLFPETGRCLE